MQLIRALRLEDVPRLALVGSGGKTTALFALARQLLAQVHVHCVLVTASTHLATSQLPLADQHFTLNSLDDLTVLDDNLPGGLILLTGSLSEPERTDGLSPVLLDRLHSLAQNHICPLLVEADGSRQRALKAPAHHEPVIPPWVEHVVVVAGLSGLDKPLNGDWVHRPERFARLSTLSPGDRITPRALARVLNHVQGGLKNIPPNARRLALLNQADRPELQAVSQRMSESLLGPYHAVLVGSLAHTGKEEANGKGAISAVYEPVAGIILAAGGASRMGSPKQTLLWRGETLVRHTAKLALAAGLTPVIVVSGYAADEVRTTLRDLPVRCVLNPNWEIGQSTSVITGLETLPEECGAAIFLLADQPRVPVRLVRSLVEAHSRELSPIIAPMIDGQRANPVLFDREVFADLLRLRGDVGGRGVFAQHNVEWLPWHDPRPLFDIDTPEDYERLLGIDRPDPSETTHL